MYGCILCCSYGVITSALSRYGEHFLLAYTFAVSTTIMDFTGTECIVFVYSLLFLY